MMFFTSRGRGFEHVLRPENQRKKWITPDNNNLPLAFHDVIFFLTQTLLSVIKRAVIFYFSSLTEGGENEKGNISFNDSVFINWN